MRAGLVGESEPMRRFGVLQAAANPVAMVERTSLGDLQGCAWRALVGSVEGDDAIVQVAQVDRKSVV